MKSNSYIDDRDKDISDLTAINPLTQLRYLILDGNEIRELGSLVEMVKEDAEGEKRFAPFLRVYLSGNPLSDSARKSAIAALKKYGVRVTVDKS